MFVGFVEEIVVHPSSGPAFSPRRVEIRHRDKEGRLYEISLTAPAVSFEGMSVPPQPWPDGSVHFQVGRRIMAEFKQGTLVFRPRAR